MDWRPEEEQKFITLWENGGGWPSIATLAVDLFTARASVPAGQVAEDEAELRHIINGVEWIGNGRAVAEAALSRLAAGAQRAWEREASLSEMELTEAYGSGAEDMRAACWEAVQEALEPGFPRVGWEFLWDTLKAAIEGATP